MINDIFSKLDEAAKLEAKTLKQEMVIECEALLDWWMRIMPDREHGGFYGQLDGYNVLHKKADKGIILHTRILWTFAVAAKQFQNKQYSKIADEVFEYILQHFWDTKEGGVFWTVDFNGRLVDATKQIYAQSFAIYAFITYYDLSSKPDALGKAMQVFNLLEKYAVDREKGGYLNVFNRDWSPAENQQLSEKDEDQSKIMNTHLHLIEAYATLYHIAPNTQVHKALIYGIRLIIDKFCDRQPRNMYIYFDENWQPSSEERSFGHDIECSWLLWEAAAISNDPTIIREASVIALELVDVVLNNGINPDGSIIEKTDPTGKILETIRVWWPQAEAIVGFLNAYSLDPKQTYWDALIKCWSHIKKHFKDLEFGEWYWMLDANNKPIRDKEDKAGPWKGPYHNVRMCLEVLKRL